MAGPLEQLAMLIGVNIPLYGIYLTGINLNGIGEKGICGDVIYYRRVIYYRCVLIQKFRRLILDHACNYGKFE